MALTDTRKTILQIINEVREKLGINDASSLTSDKTATLLLNLLNDVIADVSDYKDWIEMRRTVEVTVSTSVYDYSVETSAVVKSVHELVFSDNIAPMYLVTLDDIRRLVRSGGTGEPRQWAPISVDSVGNPVVRIYPVPGANENNEVLNVLYYKKPRLYTTSDVSTYPEFDSRMLVMGLLAATILEESGGQPTQQYQMYQKLYIDLRKSTYNRFNSDSGSDTMFRPSFGRARYS